MNGAQGNTDAIRIEGQDATNGYLHGFSQHTQPSVDAIQEISIQTSNFSAEFGQVGGGFFNFTMKSGTNQFHGSGYDYFVNEALNAGQPFTNNGTGGLLRNVQRRNDYGGTIGGPVWIPKVYNGHNKTFFFFNWEQFRETQNYNTVFDHRADSGVPDRRFQCGPHGSGQQGSWDRPSEPADHPEHGLRSEHHAGVAERDGHSRSVRGQQGADDGHGPHCAEDPRRSCPCRTPARRGS